MKRIYFLIIAAFCCLSLQSQDKSEEFATRYALLVNKLGPTGVGIETLVNKWEAECPEDVRMLYAKFSYYYNKSQKNEVVKKDQARFMGNAPVLSLDDSTGAKINYFEEVIFDDEMFGVASQSLDKIIKLTPDDLTARINKITSLLAYEKESPDMALQSIISLIDYNYSNKPVWSDFTELLPPESFENTITDFCFILFKIASPATYEGMKEISSMMVSYCPKNAEFQSNLGTYYFVFKKDNKTAQKYYSKALKLDPKNYSAIHNSLLLARLEKNVKLEKKVLPLLLAVSTDEKEKAAAQMRLDSMK